MSMISSLIKSRGVSGLLILGAFLLAGMTGNAGAQTISVSGGGQALKTACDTASTGAVLEITDDLSYDAFWLDKAVTIRAASGKSPKVVPTSWGNPNNPESRYGMVVAGLGRLATWDGVDMILSEEGTREGQILTVYPDTSEGASPSDFTIKNCTIGVDLSDNSSLQGPCLALQDKVHMINCTIRRTDNNDVTMAYLAGSAGNSVFEGCTFGPTNHQHGMMQQPSATGMVSFTDCHFSGINSSRYAICTANGPLNWDIKRCDFIGVGAIGLYSTASVFNISESVLGPRSAGAALIDAQNTSGNTLNFTNCVLTALGGEQIQIYSIRKSQNWSFKHCTFLQQTSFGGANFFKISDFENNFTGALESTFDFQNCIFNFPESNDFSMLPMPGVQSQFAGKVNAGKNLWNMVSVSTDDGLRNVGQDLDADPLLNPADGYHLLSGSPAIDSALDAGITTDIDGNLRPQGAAPDLGADEFETVNTVQHWDIY